MSVARRFHVRVTALPGGRALVTGSGEGKGGRTISEIFDPTIGRTGGFRLTTPSPVPLGGHVAIRLPDDTVLVAGGLGAGGGHVGISKRSYLYDPVSETWTRAGDLPFATMWATTKNPAVLLPESHELPEGGVLVAGGERGQDWFRDEVDQIDQYPSTRKTYVWDAAGWDVVDGEIVRGRWIDTQQDPTSEAGLMAEAHLYEDVFPAGFEVDRTTYAVGTPIPTWVGTVVEGHRVFSAGTEAHMMVRLADGRVLKLGGRFMHPSHDDTTANAEIFDPTTFEWTSVKPLPSDASITASDRDHGDGTRCWLAATLLDDGTVLVVGGDTASLSYVEPSATWPYGSFTGTPERARRTTLIYDPDTDEYTRVGDLVTPRGGLDLVPDPAGGGVFAVGGRWLENEYGDYLFVEPTVERFDRSTSTWAVATGAAMPSQRIRAADWDLTNASGQVSVSPWFSGIAASAVLDDGSYLVVGGDEIGTDDPSAVARRFIPSGAN